MADKELINTSVDEYLISLANSINHAQRYISQLRVVGQDGQPTVSYQLPRVDFELKLMFQLDRRHPPAGSTQRNIAKGEGGGYLEAHPLNSDSAGAASTIKGSFVAVPIHGGAPPPVIDVTWDRPSNESGGDGDRKISITVSVRSAGTSPLEGIEVQFNLDKEMARRLNEPWKTEPDFSKILANTRLDYGIRITGANGLAQNTLVIGDSLSNLRVPVVIDVMGVTKSMIFTPRSS